MQLFHRTLVATDFSEASTPAFEEAILMARENGSELLIAKLNALIAEARKAGIAAKPLILAGAAHEAITEAAKENDDDLVIMGTHGRKGVARLFLGSVALRVMTILHV